MTEDSPVDIDCLYAAEREPLLLDHPGNPRRRATLEGLRRQIVHKADEEARGAKEFLWHMSPDSTLDAWEMLYHRLEGAAPPLAQIAASEYRLAHSDVWGAMRTGEDMIPHIYPMCVRFDERRRDALGSMRGELRAALGAMSESALPGQAMRTYITNLARFGSRADDEMTLLIVDELYIRRGLLEEACGVCEEILGFGGLDRDRMASSRLFEDIMLKVLGGLEGRDRKGRGLAARCRALLERRSDLLGLMTRPNPDDGNELRALSEFVSGISARRRIYPAERLGEHVGKNYPRSHRFLELDNSRNLAEMVEGRSPLAANLSAHIGAQEAAAARRLDYEGGSALMRLEPMLGVLKGANVRPSVLEKWRAGIRGRQLWECLFEMEMFLRLVRAGADVTPDVKVGKKVVDLGFSGCYAEVYSPLEGEVLVPGHVVTDGDPGTHFMRRVLSKGQLGEVGEHETLMVVECTIGSYSSVADLGEKMRALMGQSGQPGGVFFVAGVGSPRREYRFIENPGAAAPVSGPAIDTMRRALELEFPPPGS